MKIKISLKNCFAVILATTALIASGCMKDKLETPGDKEPESSIFDFNTRLTTTLAVQYDVPEGYSVYFEVYTENPEYLDADGQIVKKNIEPVDVGFTDGKGKYSLPLSVTAATEQVYIYSPYAGVPRVLTAQIKAGGISVAQLPVPAVQSMTSRAADDYKKEAYNTIQNGTLKRLGYWINGAGYQLSGTSYYRYGRPDYVGDKITVSADILNLVNQTLPEGSNKVSPDLIKNGDIRVTEMANVDVHLIDEQTSANSTLAYYCYDTQNPPQSTADIKDIVIAFPNSKVFKYHDYRPSGYNGALERGEGVRLHYWKDGKDMGDVFPANTSIGWVIYNQSYATGVDGKALNDGQTRFFGAKNLNSDQRGHVALFRSGDKVIFGFEDWNDFDYNDVVFYVKSNPIEAITPDVPEVTPDPPTDNQVVATAIFRGILTYEDLWPNRGDFDMNDVVVSYESTVGYNQKNEVLQTNDKFTVLFSGATFNNSFAYQLDVRRSEAEISITSSRGGDGGAYVDQTLDKATIRLANNILDYANASTKAVFNVVTKYTGRRIAKNDFTNPPYNPFITTANKSSEVHLTNMRPTEAINKSLLGTAKDYSQPDKNLYYITYDDAGTQMPFAIDIAFNNAEDMSKFVITEERMRIDYFYPGFISWILSNGTLSQDWYLHPKK